MKKLISMLLLLSILLSLCACGEKQPTDASTEATEATQETTEATEETMPQLAFTPEELYGHIDQTKPNDEGIYKIWNHEGVANMVNVPDGKFELLCNVDMQGAALQPIGTSAAPFTGEINGANFIISNFTLEAAGGDALGFVGVNNGTIRDLQLEGMSVTADANVKHMGTLAGVNNGTILRSKATGTVTAEAAADGAACGGAVGTNTGDLTNTTITVDVLFSAAGAANVGGIAGTTTGGKIEYIESYGAITVTGENKTCGLFTGSMENTPITTCAFVGADNSLNGELFTNLTATGDQALVTGCVIRDNTPVIIPENEEKLRDTVVARMNELGSIAWQVKEPLEHESGIWSVGIQYYGMPYKHQGASITRLNYTIDEDGYLKDFMYDMDALTIQGYMGTDCSTAVQTALYSVSNSVSFGHCSSMYPWDEVGGCLYVGDWEPDPSLSVSDSRLHIDYNGEEKIYECYALLKKGDAYVYHIPQVGGHTRLAAENAVVVRDQNGKIDPNYSYVVSSEQGWTTSDTENKTYTTCRVLHKYTFANLMYDGALPVTIEEYQTGEMEPATAEFTGAVEGKMGLVSGTVKTNYYLDYVNLVIKDSAGNEVFNHIMFPGMSRTGDTSHNWARRYIDSFDMGRFATPLAGIRFELGETYTYTISATNIPGDTFVVYESSFTYGSAE